VPVEVQVSLSLSRGEVRLSPLGTSVINGSTVLAPDGGW
jgi:hypothetical protein